jgi:hypothetical protein
MVNLESLSHLRRIALQTRYLTISPSELQEGASCQPQHVISPTGTLSFREVIYLSEISAQNHLSHPKDVPHHD